MSSLNYVGTPPNGSPLLKPVSAGGESSFGPDAVVTATRDRVDVEPASQDSGAPSGFYVRHGKRIFDLIAGSLLLLVMAIPMLIISIGVRMLLGKGVLYRQARVGLDGDSFTVFKFRTMHPDRRAIPVGTVEDGIPDRRVVHKTVSDPRHTGFGRFLRRCSLDELPQLFNVVRGQMSLIGPRPELVHLVERMTPEQQLRHAVRPGVTGPWQITSRGTLLTGDAIALDLEYIRNISLRSDVWLLVRTPAVALFGRTGS